MIFQAIETYGPRISLKPRIRKVAHDETDVGRVVDKHYKDLSMRLHEVLQIWGKKIAKKVKTEYAKFGKNAEEPSDDEIVQRIIDMLSLAGFSQDIIDEMMPDLVRVYKAAEGDALLNVGFSTDGMTDQMDEAAKAFAEEHAAELIKDFAGSNEDYIRALVANAIEDGSSPDELADQIMEAGAFGEARAEMIARTELANAHVQGNLQGWKDSGVVESKKWLTAPDCCDDCEELDGEVVGLDEDFPNDGGDGPPLHPRCLIGETVISASGVSAYSKRRFRGEIIRIGIAGEYLSVTPNHPILTSRGWIAAKDLSLTDYIFKATDPFVFIRGVNPDSYHVESRIDEIPDTFIMSGGMSSTTVPTSAEDFHGDGITDGEVNIVWPASLIMNGGDAKLLQDGENLALTIAHRAHTLLNTNGNHAFFFERNLSASNSGMGSTSEFFPVFFAGSGHSDGHTFTCISDGISVDDKSSPNSEAMTTDAFSNINTRLSSHISLVEISNFGVRKPSFNDTCLSGISDSNTSLNQNTPTSGISDFVFLTEAVDTFSRGISIHNVTDLTVEQFDGHVYNLETDIGWFLANGIITHNCRCTVIAVTEKQDTDEESDEQDTDTGDES